MERSNKIVVVCHCVINQNSVVKPLARAKGAFSFVKNILDEGIGVIQLPCPELRFLGTERKPKEKEEYDVPEYRSLCKELLIPIIDEIKMYKLNGYTVTRIIGIKESPTCSITGRRGILMEEIFKLLDEDKVEINYFEVPAMDNVNSINLYKDIKESLEL